MFAFTVKLWKMNWIKRECILFLFFFVFISFGFMNAYWIQVILAMAATIVNVSSPKKKMGKRRAQENPLSFVSSVLVMRVHSTIRLFGWCIHNEWIHHLVQQSIELVLHSKMKLGEKDILQFMLFARNALLPSKCFITLSSSHREQHIWSVKRAMLRHQLYSIGWSFFSVLLHFVGKAFFFFFFCKTFIFLREVYGFKRRREKNEKARKKKEYTERCCILFFFSFLWKRKTQNFPNRILGEQ